MAQQSLLPIPEPLDIHNLAKGLSTKKEPIQVSTLLTVIDASARPVFATFQFEPVEDQNKISAVHREHSTDLILILRPTAYPD